MTKKEIIYQKQIEARLTAESNAKKSKNCVKAGNLHSQWGRVVTNEQRLIDNGHYMKTGKAAQLAFLREQVRKLKKEQGKSAKLVLVKRG